MALTFLLVCEKNAIRNLWAPQGPDFLSYCGERVFKKKVNETEEDGVGIKKEEKGEYLKTET